MQNSFSRSWEITKLSFRVMTEDKELFLFPVLAGAFSLFFAIALIFPTVILSVLRNRSVNTGMLGYLLLFVVYFGLAFIATFFNVCVVYTVKTRFGGGNATFSESIGFAFSKIHLIFSWSLLSATVGLVLRLLDNMAQRSGKIGEIIGAIVVSLLGMAWSVLTIFVVPVMVYNELGPIDAIKKSALALKKTWGESIIQYIGLGLMQLIFILAGVVIGILAFILFAGLGTYAIAAVIVLFVTYFVAVMIFFSIASTIFNTALYVYADTGKIPMGYNKEIMVGAFRSKKSL